MITVRTLGVSGPTEEIDSSRLSVDFPKKSRTLLIQSKDRKVLHSPFQLGVTVLPELRRT